MYLLLCSILHFHVSQHHVLRSIQSNERSSSVGPISISLEQIVVGIIVEVLALIPSLLIVQLFRRLRTRQQPISPLQTALSKINVQVKINAQKKKSGLTLPWWCLFLVYGLCAILVAVSVFFIIVRGIEFGDLKTQQWLASILTGFFSSILLTQPIKIISLAIFFACFCRNTNNDEEANEYLDENEIDLEIDEDPDEVCLKI